MTNSFEVSRAALPAASLTTLAKSVGFRPLAMFGLAGQPVHAQSGTDETPDLVEEAHAQGFAQGLAEGRAMAEAEALAAMQARGQLSLAFERLDREMEEDLRLALRDTVAALCEGVLAPLALDELALLARIEKAVAMLSRSYDERTIRLHPEDLELVSERLRADWHVQPDPSLARGALRVESTESGIEDGPETWRRAIADALGPC